jgi:hypothetical protein
LKCLTKDGGQTWKFGLADRDGLPGNDDFGWEWDQWNVSPVKAFEALWVNINGAESWDQNHWIWALTFKVHHQNIDAFLKNRGAA